MSSLRSLERTVIRNQCYRKYGNTKAFKSEWDKRHNKRVETVNADGTVKNKSARTKKKGRSHDMSRFGFGRLISKLRKNDNSVAKATV